MKFKPLIKSVLQRSGLDIVRFVPELNRPFAILPLLVREHIASGEPFFFVQVGANDGIFDDPLHDLILEHHLRGLLIEPLPDIFQKLKFNYRDQPQLLFENMAISSCDGTMSIHRVRNNVVTSHHSGIASFTRKNLLKQGVPPEHIETLSVQGTSLQSLLAKHKINRINLLQIDTEGYDFEVIKSAFEDEIFPDMIHYEHCWLIPEIRFKCKQMLDKHGYQFIEAGKDTIAVRIPK